MPQSRLSNAILACLAVGAAGYFGQRNGWDRPVQYGATSAALYIVWPDAADSSSDIALGTRLLFAGALVGAVFAGQALAKPPAAA